jgi:hypothetical protein
MVVSNYDSFLDPRTWPDANEVSKLRAIYGWDAREALAVAPHWHPSGVSATAPDGDASETSDVTKDSGAPRGTRTPDPQVRSQPEERDTAQESSDDPSPSRTEPE